MITILLFLGAWALGIGTGRLWNTWNVRALAGHLADVRRRAAADLARAGFDATVIVLRELLPVFDSLDRAVRMELTGATADAVIAGVRLIQRQALAALEQLDVDLIDIEGARFDPKYHHAVLYEESGSLPPGLVAKVLERGYRLGEHLLRPARVVVSRRPTAAPAWRWQSTRSGSWLLREGDNTRAVVAPEGAGEDYRVEVLERGERHIQGETKVRGLEAAKTEAERRVGELDAAPPSATTLEEVAGGGGHVEAEPGLRSQSS